MVAPAARMIVSKDLAKSASSVSHVMNEMNDSSECLGSNSLSPPMPCSAMLATQRRSSPLNHAYPFAVDDAPVVSSSNASLVDLSTTRSGTRWSTSASDSSTMAPMRHHGQMSRPAAAYCAPACAHCTTCKPRPHPFMQSNLASP